MKNEMKPEFVSGLGMLIAMYSRAPVRSMTYHQDTDGFEAVEIGFDDGSTHTVNVTADSVLAIMHDLYRALV